MCKGYEGLKQFQELKGLTSEEVRRNLAENPDDVEIADIYSKALVAENAVIAVAAQEELARRGDYDYIKDRFNVICQEEWVELNTGFRDRLAQSLMQMSDPYLKRIARIDMRESLDGSERISMKELLDGVELDNIERTAADSIKMLIEQSRHCGEHIDFSSVST